EPARLDVRLINHFDQRLIASHGGCESAENLGVDIEASGSVRNPHISHRHPETIERPARCETNEADAAVQIKIDQVSIWRAVSNPAESRDARPRRRDGVFGDPRRSVEGLLYYRVDPKVTAKLYRDAGSSGVGDRKALCGKALIVELPEMSPGSGCEVTG